MFLDEFDVRLARPRQRRPYGFRLAEVRPRAPQRHVDEHVIARRDVIEIEDPRQRLVLPVGIDHAERIGPRLLFPLHQPHVERGLVAGLDDPELRPVVIEDQILGQHEGTQDRIDTRRAGQIFRGELSFSGAHGFSLLFRALDHIVQRLRA